MTPSAAVAWTRDISLEPLDDGIVDVPEWDVDNNGDGVAESIWMDFGLPTMRSADGRVECREEGVQARHLDP